MIASGAGAMQVASLKRKWTILQAEPSQPCVKTMLVGTCAVDCPRKNKVAFLDEFSGPSLTVFDRDLPARRHYKWCRACLRTTEEPDTMSQSIRRVSFVRNYLPDHLRLTAHENGADLRDYCCDCTAYAENQGKHVDLFAHIFEVSEERNDESIVRMDWLREREIYLWDLRGHIAERAHLEKIFEDDTVTTNRWWNERGTYFSR